ncbi:hypothetical protein BDW71DRAFT_170074 [Aspergillus fruticulosus]
MLKEFILTLAYVVCLSSIRSRLSDRPIWLLLRSLLISSGCLFFFILLFSRLKFFPETIGGHHRGTLILLSCFTVEPALREPRRRRFGLLRQANSTEQAVVCGITTDNNSGIGWWVRLLSNCHRFRYLT